MEVADKMVNDKIEKIKETLISVGVAILLIAFIVMVYATSSICGDSITFGQFFVMACIDILLWLTGSCLVIRMMED